MTILSAAIAAVILGAVGLADKAEGHNPALDNGSRLLSVMKFADWTTTGAGTAETVLESPVYDSGLAWDQFVLSWNAETPPSTRIRFEARGIYPDHTTKYYTMGFWSNGDGPQMRESVNGQKDADGDVDTDTLIIKQPGAKVQIRTTLYGPQEGSPPASSALPTIRFLGLNFCDTKTKHSPLPPNRKAWGKLIDVPERCQLSYKNGDVLCSATSTSMMLAHWSKSLKRPELDHDVDEVAKGVFDNVWHGTGNWPFNTAYAGNQPGIRAYITRFSDVSELEDWIAAGIPVVCSVSYKLLKGMDKPEASGHIVVCVGFTKDGDVIMNDPWAHLEKGEKVRKTFLRKNLIAGWGHSHNTVYLIYPEGAKLPTDRFGHWEGK
jgi:uncharacterized protein YvpB